MLLRRPTFLSIEASGLVLLLYVVLSNISRSPCYLLQGSCTIFNRLGLKIVQVVTPSLALWKEPKRDTQVFQLWLSVLLSQVVVLLADKQGPRCKAYGAVDQTGSSPQKDDRQARDGKGCE
jgi:hypothetical protein